MHTHIHACMHARTHAHTHARTHAHTHAHTHARTRARTHARTYARTNACTHARTHACMHARTHTLMYTHAHACTYAGKRTHGRLSHIVSVLQKYAAANMPRVLQELAVGNDKNVINVSDKCVANQHTARVHVQDASSP